MEKLDLEAIRRRIDKIDAQLVAALEERMEAVLEVAAYKNIRGCLCLMRLGKLRCSQRPVCVYSIKSMHRLLQR